MIIITMIRIKMTKSLGATVEGGVERGERTVRLELFRDVLRGQGEQLARVFDIKINRVGA